MYEVRPSSTPDLKKRNLQRNEAIPHDLLQHILTSLPGRMHECGGCDGGHMENVILRC